MCGIYVHIPFCRKACVYCNFHFSTSLKNEKAFTEAIIKEIILRKDFFAHNDIVRTLYFGGGTPSFLKTSHLIRIAEAIQKNFHFQNAIEFSLEANPEDISKDYLKALLDIGVNRLSLGVQSFNKNDLQFLQRPHDAQKAIDAIKLSQDIGFDNISIDLIYGIPISNDDIWAKNIEIALKLDIPHISAYALTVEEKTILAHQIKHNKAINIIEEQQITQHNILKKKLSQNNFLHYETSNFAKTDTYFSKHNLGYWQGAKYLGLGPSAHSYNQIERQWHTSNTSKYINSIKQGCMVLEKEVLDIQMKYNEYIFTSLRTMWGGSFSIVEKEFGGALLKHLQKELKPHLLNQNIIIENNNFYLSNKARLFSDAIASDLFIT